jgi:DNA-binding MarR family transcriptional regulator
MTKYVTRQGRRIAVETMVLTAPKRNKDDRHIGCPVGWFKRVLQVTQSKQQFAVALWLQRQRAISRNKDLFPVSNSELESELRINRKVKYKTLRKLEKAGAIDIIRDGKRAIQVRILW